MLGLGSNITKAGKIGKPIVKDGLVLKHGYTRGPVQPCSTGAADINADAAADEYIDVGAIVMGTGDISVSAWVYVTTWVTNAGIFTNRLNSGTYPGISVRHKNGVQRFEVNIDDGGSSTAIESDLKNANQWYHVCTVLDRSGLGYLYIDGVLEDSASITSENLTLAHADNAFIGKNEGTLEHRGYICNVGYWNAALTQPQIKSIMHKDYASLSASEKTGLVSWWNLDEQTDPDGTAGTGGVKDYHGSNHGTLE